MGGIVDCYGGRRGLRTFQELDSKGQMSIFLGVVMLIIMGLLAFTINIGIFVKSKINLQNAVDAAAYSGAAVQARQLTNIAYMNWEMRNIYKEWMLKYYVLGQLNHPGVRKAINAPNERVDYRLPPLCGDRGSPCAAAFSSMTHKSWDPWNIPSICIDLVGTYKICNTYTLPGLPKFGALGAPGLDDTHMVFMSVMEEQKSLDCAKRSNLNFLLATQWTYGMEKNAFLPANIPKVALHRRGAFPLALEAAIRVRNLERIINQPPHRTGITASNVAALENQPHPIHERTVKAFWAGYRNLAKSPDGEKHALKRTFTLTELSPGPRVINSDFDKNLSTYLMGGIGSNGFSPSEKHYVDLQLQLVNYAIFFNLFHAGEALVPATSGTPHPVGEAASCPVVKVAIPVPGYPLGFIKNPNILTYYAVKGVASFTGLFNPFQGPIKMEAYAAAKPFGGRIGPHLFKVHSEQELRTRPKLSFSYISGLQIGISSEDIDQDSLNSYPIPHDQDFWLEGRTNEVVGGIPNASDAKIKFGIPNMPFDFVTGDINGFGAGASDPAALDSFQPIKEYSGPGLPSESAGLYSSEQLTKFTTDSSGLLVTGLTATGGEEVARAIYNVLRPTAYEAGNYLIPSLEAHNQRQKVQSIGAISSAPGPTDLGTLDNPFRYDLYAPLFGEGLLFQGPDDVSAIIQDYLDRNEPAIKKYLKSLKRMAVFMAGFDVANGGDEYSAAARVFHSKGVTQVRDGEVRGTGALQSEVDRLGEEDDTCESIAGKFGHLFFNRPGGASIAQCPPFLKDAMVDYWHRALADTNRGRFRNFFQREYVRPQDVTDVGGNIKKYMTGYLPGDRHGANDETGELQQSYFHPIGKGSGANSYRRNHYSVKFVLLQSLTRTPPSSSYEQGTFSLLGENVAGDRAPSNADDTFTNFLQGENLEDVDH